MLYILITKTIQNFHELKQRLRLPYQLQNFLQP